MARYISSTNRGYQLIVDIETLHQNVDNNSSNIKVKLILKTSGNYFEHKSNGALAVNGVTMWSVNNTTLSVRPNTENVIVNKTTTIFHNQDGGKSINVSANFRTVEQPSYVPSGTLAVSGTYSLNAIPRASTIKSYPERIYTDNAIFDISCDIKTDKFDTYMEIFYTKNDKWTGLGVFYKNVSSATVNLRGTDRARLNQIVQDHPNQKEVVLTLAVTTKKKNTNEVIGVDKRYITCVITEEYKPTITSIQLTEVSERVKALNLINNTFILRYSNIRYLINGNARFNATLTSSQLTVGDYTVQGNNQVFKAYQKVSSVTGQFGDSRGLKNTLSVPINLVEYTEPQIKTFKVSRQQNGLSERLTASVEITCTDIQQKNTFNFKIMMREKNGSQWQTIYSLSDCVGTYKNENINLSTIASASKAYEVMLSVGDKLSGAVTPNEIPTATIVVHKGSKGYAIGGFLSNFNHHGLQVHGSIVDDKNTNYLLKAYPIGAIYIHTMNVNPSTFLGGRWERFGQGRTLIGVNESDRRFSSPRLTGGSVDLPLPIVGGHHNGNFKGFLQHDNNKKTLTEWGSFGRGWDLFDGNELKPAIKKPTSDYDKLQPYITVFMWVRIG